MILHYVDDHNYSTLDYDNYVMMMLWYNMMTMYATNIYYYYIPFSTFNSFCPCCLDE